MSHDVIGAIDHRKRPSSSSDVRRHIITATTSTTSTSQSMNPSSSTASRPPPEDERIAVVGISSILPSGENLNESWESIIAGLDHIRDLPADRLDVTAYFDPNKTTKDKIYCKRGGFIPQYDFDPREFGLNMLQLEDSDANQMLTLLKVKEALVDASIEPFTKEKKNIGCVLGIGGGQKASHEFYSRLNYVVVEKVLRKLGMPEEDVQVAVEKYKANFPEWRLDSFPGFLGNVTAGRCTNTFNLEGMNCVVDAACASSLIALKVCIDELLYGDCDTMICGATCTDNSIGMYMAFSKTPVFSTSPNVSAYDESTKGMLIGEGSVMMVLKRLKDAELAGDTIHAVIRGCASSSDGRAPGIYVPTISGQEQCIRRAWHRAGLDPKTCTLVEGHGTGTPVGDKIELTALRNVFKENGTPNQQIAVGSVKSQIGHLKAVAGMAGLLKVILSLKHKVLAASINVERPPSLMDGSNIADSCLYINTRLRPWFVEPGNLRRAAVSSFGFGGANYHCVLDEYEPEHKKPYRMQAVWVPVLISASSSQELAAICNFEMATIAGPETVKALINKYGRMPPPPTSHARVGMLVTTLNPAACMTTLQLVVRQLESSGNKPFSLNQRQCNGGVAHFRPEALDYKGKVAALFGGQGAQYVNMFDGVALNWPELREAVTAMDRAGKAICGERISGVLYPRQPYKDEPPLTDKKISSVQNSQLSTVAVTVGCYDILRNSGFRPDFVCGHSLGEYPALYASGAFKSVDDMMELVCHRAFSMEEFAGSQGGKMAAIIGKGADAIRPEADSVWLANCNSPTQTVITGEAGGVKRDSDRLAAAGFRVVPLNTAGAYHSPMMAPAERKFNERLAGCPIVGLSPDAPRTYANVTGTLYPTGSVDAVRKNLSVQMTSSVQFMNEVKAMYKDGARVFVEFGPKNVLGKLVEQIVGSSDDILVVSVNALGEQSDSDAQLREAALKLIVAGMPLLEKFDPWGVENKFLKEKAAKSKTVLRLSATTYIAPKTIQAREAAMNDGASLSCFRKLESSKPSVATPTPVDNTVGIELAKVKEELRAVREQLRGSEDKLKQAQQAAPPALVSDEQRRLIESIIEENERNAQQLRAILNGNVSDLLRRERSASAKPTIKAPAPSQARPVLPSQIKISASNVEEVVMSLLAASTGYDLSMLEPGLELEADLGIDSIKRVEFASNAQDVLGITVTDTVGLGRAKTVAHVIEILKQELSNVKPSESPRSEGLESPKQSSMSVEQAKKTLFEVVASLTGFEENLLELDNSLETDLGVDSIKRVEMLAEIQNRTGITARDVDALARSNTLGDVLEVLKREIGAAPAIKTEAAIQHAPVTQKPTPAPVAPTTSSSSANGHTVESAKKILFEVVSSLTGFEENLLELDNSLETDLGVDSIKRVEMLAEIQNRTGITAKDVDALARSNTLGDVLEVLKREIGAGPAVATEPAHKPAPIVLSAAPVVQKPVPVAVVASSSANGHTVESAKKILFEVVSSLTGFEENLLELDNSLETDLGVDSIKRVEMLAEIQNRTGITAKDVDALARSNTLGDVLEVLKREIGAGPTLATEPAHKPALPIQVTPSAQKSAPVAAIVSSPANGHTVESAKKILFEVVSSLTGFEENLLELDNSLETDLGVDSIKRVEMLAEIQNRTGITAKDVDALARSNTLGDVLEVLKREIGAAPTVATEPAHKPAPAIQAAPSVQKSAPAAATISSSANGHTVESAKKILFEVVSSLTGFEENLLELDNSLETDLGVDSIKRVEMLAEIQNRTGITAKDVDALARSNTLGDVLEVLKREIGAETTISSPPITKEKENLNGTHPEVKSNGSHASANGSSHVSNGSSAHDAEGAAKVILKVIGELTGYDDESMLENDMNLESDLGIDSIKRVELLSAVQDRLGVQAKDVDALARTNTIGEVIQALQNELNNATPSGAGASKPKSVPSTTTGTASSLLNSGSKLVNLRGKDCDHLWLTAATATEIPLPDELILKPSSNRPIIIVDDGKGVAAALIEKLSAKGNSTILLSVGVAKSRGNGRSITVDDFSEAALESALKGISTEPSGFIFFFQAINAPLSEQLGWAMLVAKHLKKKLEKPVEDGRTFFIAITRMDGKLGLGGVATDAGDVVDCAERGAVFGLCKTLALESPNIFSRGIDIATGVHADVAAALVMNELSDPDLSVRESGYDTSGKRFTSRAVPLVGDGSPVTPVSASDVWLVAGGARGITPLCVREMARLVKGGTYLLMGRSKLVEDPKWAEGLVGEAALKKGAMAYLKDEFDAGRGEKPTPKLLNKTIESVLGAREIKESVLAINAVGGSARYISGDVTSAESIRNACAGFKVTGIMHASGVLRDKLIQDKKLSEFEDVYGTKVTGLRALLNSVDISSLRHLVVFSSLAGFHGNVGQVDYSMANEVLNKAVFEIVARYPACSGRALDFGPWNGGMVTPQLENHFKEMGVQIIPREGGAQTVALTLLHSRASQCLYGNWGLPPAKPLMPRKIIKRQISAGSNPFLTGHMIKGKKVVPMTVSLCYLASVAASTYPGYQLLGVVDGQLFRGLTLENNNEKILGEIHLDEQQDHDSSKVIVKAELVAMFQGKLVPSYRALVELGLKPQPPLNIPQLKNLEPDSSAMTKQEIYVTSTLFHGPSFQVIDEVFRVGEKGVCARCHRVPSTPEEEGQFPTTIADGITTDAGFQLMVLWARKVSSARSLPNFAKSIQFFKPIAPNEIFYATLLPDEELKKGSAQIWQGKVFYHDSEGNVYTSMRLSTVLSETLTFA